MTDWRQSSFTDAAYSNYLVANGVVLVPVFGHAHDERAKAIIAEQFPDREIIGIDAVGLIEHGGAIRRRKRVRQVENRGIGGLTK